MVAAAFDSLALRYDELWTHSLIGRLQRQAVWRRLDRLFRPGDHLLDLGCGTGEDAVHFMQNRIRVQAIDASNEMVRIACSRGVDATRLEIEDLDQLEGSFDAVLSNFGALNCIKRLDLIRGPLARLARSGGHLAICLMGAFCFWETAWYLSRVQPRKAFRRWRHCGVPSSLGIPVYYPSVRELQRALLPDFVLVDWSGVGISIPPSYVSGLSDPFLSRLAALESLIAHRAGWRAIADHRLLIFSRK